MNDGTGSFSLSQIAGSTHPRNALQLGDYDNDGDTDICTLNFQGTEILWYPNNGGVFGNAIPIFSSPNIPLFTDMITTDFNNNGRAELAWTSTEPRLAFHQDQLTDVAIIKSGNEKPIVFPNPVNDNIKFSRTLNEIISVELIHPTLNTKWQLYKNEPGSFQLPGVPAASYIVRIVYTKEIIYTKISVVQSN